jgi:hypothetical protein
MNPDLARRWASLTGTAFRLDELKQPSQSDVLTALDTVLEVFDERIEPADDFEGAAVRRFAASLRRALTPEPPR